MRLPTAAHAGSHCITLTSPLTNNASGASGVGKFVISREDEVVEDELRNGEPQLLSSLPATVSGRLSRIEEVDQYRFVPQHAGLVNCELFAHRLGSPIHGVLEVRDAAANMVADTVDTEGVDPILTFATEADSEYVVSVRDLDFAARKHFLVLMFSKSKEQLKSYKAPRPSTMIF